MSTKLAPHVVVEYPANAWPEPEPLFGATEPMPYPTDALPSVIGEAVDEVTAFNQAPVSMAACSALSAASLASQGLASVQRAEGLMGPVSLYTLALLDSGERKTSTDEHFIAPIREYEKDVAEKAKPDISEFKAAERAWVAKGKGVEARITKDARDGKPTAQHEKELQDLESSRPTAPRVPRLLHTDSTSEAMAWALSERYPSAGVFSSEAGTVLGGHSMGKESSLRNFAFYNSAWDGRKSASDRRTQDSTRACPVRLTVWLAAQPEAVKAFVDGSRGLAMGTGFMARFLITLPKSTQGTRLFKEAPTGWPKLSAFQNRLRELLETPIAFDDSGDLALDVLDLSPEAKRLWVEFRDSVERELSPSGAMADAREFAAKAADNAARLAAIFHIFANGPTGYIGADSIAAAATIVSWHCMEALRFVGELAVPRPTANALALEAWLLDRCRSGEAVSRRDVQRLGPGVIRDNDALQEALDVLTEANRARAIQDGRRKLVEVNPALLEGNR